VDTRTEDPSEVEVAPPAQIMREALDDPDPIFTAAEHRALSWWKAKYQLEGLLAEEGIADEGHDFACRLAFALWLSVTRRISEDL
jgi:hypothetical protein